MFLAVAAIAGAAGVFFSRGNQSANPDGIAAQNLMSTALSDLSGKAQPLSQWRGKVLVVNYWATWCTPCRDEIPALMKVEHKYSSNGVKLVGIAIDNVAKVQEYAKDMQIDYTLLIGGIDTLSAVKDLGNHAGVLPFTVVLDRAGKLVYAHAGAVTEDGLGVVLGPLISKGQ